MYRGTPHAWYLCEKRLKLLLHDRNAGALKENKEFSERLFLRRA